MWRRKKKSQIKCDIRVSSILYNVDLAKALCFSLSYLLIILKIPSDLQCNKDNV